MGNGKWEPVNHSRLSIEAMSSPARRQCSTERNLGGHSWMPNPNHILLRNFAFHVKAVGSSRNLMNFDSFRLVSIQVHNHRVLFVYVSRNSSVTLIVRDLSRVYRRHKRASLVVHRAFRCLFRWCPGLAAARRVDKTAELGARLNCMNPTTAMPHCRKEDVPHPAGPFELLRRYQNQGTGCCCYYWSSRC